MGRAQGYKPSMFSVGCKATLLKPLTSLPQGCLEVAGWFLSRLGLHLAMLRIYSRWGFFLRITMTLDSVA